MRRLDALAQLIPLRRGGWTALLAGAVSFVVGWWTNWWELRLVGVFCLALVTIALAFTVGRGRHEVALVIDQDRVQVGEVAGGELRVRNAGGRRSLPARLDLPIGEHTASFALPSMAVGQAIADRFEVPTERRGVVQVGPVHSVRADPFSLAARVMRWTGVEQVFVHPHTVPLPGRQAGFVHDLEGQASPVSSNADMDFHALREYVPGDDRRQVHWRSSARAGSLMVRQFSETRQSRVALALDCAASSHLGDDEFELAVQVAGSVGLQALREGHPLQVVDGSTVLPSPHPRRLLDELSSVTTRPDHRLDSLVQQLLRRAPMASLVVLVTGSVPTHAELTAALATVPAEVRVVTVQVDTRASTRVRTIGRSTLVLLPALAELPRAMRRAMS